LTALFLTIQPDPRDDQDRLIHAKGPIVEGTCEWIKTNELYNSWLHSRSQLLWLSGGPGKGKTMLSIFLAGELERIANDSQDMLFVQYFCNNRDEKRNTATAVIRGLLFQLLSLRPKLFDYILPSFKVQKESLFTDSSFETLWRIFETMVHDPVLSTTYCVLDGLDECDEASLEWLLKKFKALFSRKSNDSSACHLNLIAVSRDLPDFIPELLSTFPRIQLDPDADNEINSDIRQFIEVKVNELSEYRQYPKPLRMHVKDVFLKRAKGTFLWVGIVANELRNCKVSEVKNSLELFPSGLEGLYARMLLQINDRRRETAARILSWVVTAVRPLTLAELSAAIETPFRSSVGLNCDEVIRDQVAFCGYFLTIKKDKVGLIHQSAKDYLLRKTPDPNHDLEFFRIEEEKANLEIARKCLAYLQNGALADGAVILEHRYGTAKDMSRLKAFPLLSYAILYWPEHARSVTGSQDIFDLSYPFYSENSPVRESWLNSYWFAEGCAFNPNSVLHLASYFGIVPLAENLLSRKGWINKLKCYIDVNKRDGFAKTALSCAAEKGHEAMVRLLLEKGADVNSKGEYGMTALHRAAESGDEAMVRLLLEKGADANVKDEDGWTALYFAVSTRHEAIVRLLLEKGADVSAKDKNGWTALRHAASTGHEAIVRLLLEKGADVSAKDKYGWTALRWAASEGYETIVRLLLEKGADVNAKDKYGWTALRQAASRGHEAIVRLLLEKGADVGIKDKDGRTALHLAADVNTKDKDGWVALRWAALTGHETIVQLLLEKGADVGIKDRDGRTALHWAASGWCEAISEWHETTARLLLEKGADVSTKDKDGWTALHLAASEGNLAIVRLLLEKGADANAKDKDGRMALHRAAESGHETTVHLLTPLS
jgi:ankyrin repeat protein